MLARVCAAVALLSGYDGAPLYTNDDLDRVHPLRAQTGATSVPVVTLASPPPPAGRAHGEAYWRREAERLQDRLAPLAERADRLRERLAERRQRPGVRPYTDPQLIAWQAQLDRIQTRMRALEERVSERARREGALPGWLR